jgi:hypothetical protein
MLGWFERMDAGHMERVPQQVALEAAGSLIDHPTDGQLGLAAALLVALAAERDHLLQVINEAGIVLVEIDPHQGESS